MNKTFTIDNIRKTIFNTDPHFWVRYGGLVDKVAYEIWDEYKDWKIAVEPCPIDGHKFAFEPHMLFDDFNVPCNCRKYRVYRKDGVLGMSLASPR